MSATTTHSADDAARTADDTARQVAEIKALLRPLMNGVLSQSLRERGLRYRLIYGIELPRLKELAATLEKEHTLAQALWKEDIRECRILAGMLQPTETFLPDICDIWMDDIRDAELADYTCMSLFRHLPYASEKAFQWIASDDALEQYTGYRLLCHLLSKPEAELNPRAQDELEDQARAAAESPNRALAEVAAMALDKLREKKD